jgi:Fur family ferric uptake transcriptional regulator
MQLSTDDLINALRERSLRITRARSAICEVLATSHEEHLGATDILVRAREKAGVKINPSTVYRTLDVLEEFGFLHHVHLGHGAGVYHLSKESDHQHLVCERCGTSVEIPLEELAPALAKVTARYGFVAEGVHFALVGTCRSCAEDLNKA